MSSREEAYRRSHAFCGGFTLSYRSVDLLSLRSCPSTTPYEVHPTRRRVLSYIFDTNSFAGGRTLRQLYVLVCTDSPATVVLVQAQEHHLLSVEDSTCSFRVSGRPWLGIRSLDYTGNITKERRGENEEKNRRPRATR